MIKLFELGENYMVTLNKEWISTIPEFRRLLARDKGGPGDGSGRFKKQATREFTYIFHLYDFHSPFENYPEADRIGQVEILTGICPKDVANDPDMMLAIERYKDLLANSSPTLRGLRSMKRAVDEMWNFFDTVNYNRTDDHGKPMYSVKTVQDSITNMPKTMESVKKLEELVKQEMDGDTGMRGDAEKGYEEDPDFDDSSD